MQTFLPYSDFHKTAQCLDCKRLGKQRVEAWQIYNILKKGEFTECACENGKLCVGIDLFNQCVYEECYQCKGKGKIKTAWYNHPIVKMWEGYEKALLLYGWYICYEWRKRGYKDSMQVRFIDEMAINYHGKEVLYPSWLGNKKFHASHRSNLLRKNPEHYKQFGWKEKDNLPYIWFK